MQYAHQHKDTPREVVSWASVFPSWRFSDTSPWQSFQVQLSETSHDFLRATYQAATLLESLDILSIEWTRLFTTARLARRLHHGPLITTSGALGEKSAETLLSDPCPAASHPVHRGAELPPKEAERLLSSVHDIKVLNRLPRCALTEIVDRGTNDKGIRGRF